MAVPRFCFDARGRRWRDRQTGKYVPARRGRRKSDRLDRAVEIVLLGNVIHGDDAFTVVSADQAHFYAVALDGQRACDCPDRYFRPGILCKHQLAAALATRRLGELLVKTGGGAGDAADAAPDADRPRRRRLEQMPRARRRRGP